MLRSIVATMTLLSASVAQAEVMDKEPALSQLWGLALTLGAIGFFAWRRQIALGAVVTLSAAALVWSFHWELQDPVVGPDILREAGRGYVAQAYAAMSACAILHVAGVAALFGGRRRRKSQTA